jgi:hypothetical protein
VQGSVKLKSKKNSTILCWRDKSKGEHECEKDRQVGNDEPENDEPAENLMLYDPEELEL